MALVQESTTEKSSNNDSQTKQYPLRNISAHPFIRYANKEKSKPCELRRTPPVCPMDYEFLSQEQSKINESTKMNESTIEIHGKYETKPHQFKVPKMDTSKLPK